MTAATGHSLGWTPSDAHVVPMQINAPLSPNAMAGHSAVRMSSSSDRHTSSEAWKWVGIPANASQVAIAQDGTLWALGDNGVAGADQSIWHYIGGGWRNLPGNARQIATSPDGTLWARNAGNSVFHYVGGSWVSIGGNASSITVDRNGNVWATGGDAANGQIWEWTGAVWQLHAGAGTGAHIASNPDNSLYVLKANGDIWGDPGFGVPLRCPGGGGVDITPKPGGTGYYVLAGQSGSNYQIWDYTDSIPGDCRTGSYNPTGWLVSSVSFLGNTLAVVSNGNVYTTIANSVDCPVAPSAARGYIPCDLQSAYSLPSATAGAGQTVGIVDAFDDPNAESDLAFYRSSFGLPACTTANGCFRKVSQTGTTSYPAPNTGWAGEISLDVDMVSAICPNCHILLVEANDASATNLTLSVDEAAALGATVISGSFGGPENSGEQAIDSHFNHPGIPIVVSSGDGGYGARYPAASPYVIAAGGTALLPSSSLRGWSETAWGYTPNSVGKASFSGAGSGCSAYEPKPAWQLDGGCGTRMIADVAAVADLNTGVAAYDTYNSTGWGVFGGTSVAAPIIAGVVALAGNSAGPAYLYAHANQLWNITAGTNGPCPNVPQYFCFAGIGYNGPTGLGTPDGLGAFGGTSIASVNRAPLSNSERKRLSDSVVANPVLEAVCPPALPGYFQCDAIVRLNSLPRAIVPGQRHDP